MDIRAIKKALMQGKIRLTSHVLLRMEKRGYTKRYLIACIMSGEKTDTQIYKNRVCVIIEGVDTDGLPMVLVIGNDFSKKTKYALVTAMPPINKKRFKQVI